MKVIGIDPAPSKKTTVYEQGDWQKPVPAQDLAAFVQTIKERRDSVLVCWDAPLTTGKLEVEGSYYTRPIETFFSTKKVGFKVPDGISVRGFAGCPHWTVSRAALGLPRFRAFEPILEALPLGLLTNESERPVTPSGHYVVEVHPAVAIWLWCRGERNKEASWEYKKKVEVRKELWEQLMAKPFLKMLAPNPRVKTPSDDEVDAFVAYALGQLWVDRAEVELLGNAETGSFLVPRVPSLAKAFESFVQSRASSALAPTPQE